MTPVELEAFVDRELAKLPRPRAPRSLVPRILSAVRQSQGESWHRLPWRAWPATSSLAAGLLCAGLALLVAYAWDGIAAAAPPDVLVAAGAVWRIVVQPAAIYLAAIGVAMFVATAMCCTALALVLRQGGPNYEAL